VRCGGLFSVIVAVDEEEVVQSLDSMEVELREDACGFLACFRDEFIQGVGAEGFLARFREAM
jgi:hypothetical protein